MQESALEYIRHGQINFFRLPRVRMGSSGSIDYAGADAVVLGVPFDGGTTYQPGARLAPYHIRRTSALIQGHHPVHRIDVFDRVRAVDGGNIPLSPFDHGASREMIHAEVDAIAEAEAAPFLVGGDHSIALPALRALAKVHGAVACIQIDAHFDTSGPEVWGEAFHHGTPFRHALDEGLIAHGQLYQVGLRAPWSHSGEDLFGQKYGAKIFPTSEIVEHGIESIAIQIREAIGDRPTYISFDIDAIDPSFAPGTGTPVPGGLSSREALKLLRGFAGVPLIGMDVVEVLPALDHADITCSLAAHILYEGLALLALGQ